MVEFCVTHEVKHGGMWERERLRREMFQVELDAIEGWRSRGEISTSTYMSLRREIVRASPDVAGLKSR